MKIIAWQNSRIEEMEVEGGGTDFILFYWYMTQFYVVAENRLAIRFANHYLWVSDPKLKLLEVNLLVQLVHKYANWD